MQTIVIVSFNQLQVKQYNLRVENQGIPPEEMQAVRAELKGTAEELDGLKFDVVVVRLLSGCIICFERIFHTVRKCIPPLRFD
jgi:hypothetical protein